MADGAPSGPDVFLSYAREDEARARQLATALDQHGFSVFWDREVPPGQTWHSYIGEALTNARCVVVAWSSHSVASPWVLEEASEGKDRDVLVPVLFEKVQPPFGFRAIQAADLTNGRSGRSEPAFDSFVNAVQRIVGGQSGSAAAAEPELPGASGSTPAAKDAVKPAMPSRATRPKPGTSSDGQISRWSSRTVAAIVVGGAALAGAGGIVWLRQPLEPTPPAAVADAEPPAPETRTAEPTVDAEPAGPAPAPTDAESPPRVPEPSEAPPPSATAEPGDEMRDCPECPEMVLVPAGTFTMGSPPAEPGRSEREGPRRTVTIAEPLWVGKYEVSFIEWHACVAAGKCEPSRTWWKRDNRPVVEVSWNDAQAYVDWLSQKTGKPYRLLSEAEWEYVSRAGTTTAYWWGDDVGNNNANCDGCGSEWDEKLAPVGSFRANGFGLYDTAGNVYEWVQDCWRGHYEGAPTDGSPWFEGDCSIRVVRGGSYFTPSKDVRSAARFASRLGKRPSNFGVRIARAAD